MAERIAPLSVSLMNPKSGRYRLVTMRESARSYSMFPSVAGYERLDYPCYCSLCGEVGRWWESAPFSIPTSMDAYLDLIAAHN